MRTKLITLLAVGALTAPAIAQAQSSAAQDLTVSVDIIAPLTLTQVAGTDLAFGTVAAGVTPTAIAPAAGVQFRADGHLNTAITVTYAPVINLTGAGADIPFTANLVGHDADAAASATTVASATARTLNGSGQYFFWLGGSLAAIPAGQTPGAYSAAWTLTVAY